MVIWWGKKTDSVEVVRGKFLCPQCESERFGIVKDFYSASHVYGISLGGRDKVGRGVTCATCDSTFVAPDSLVQRMQAEQGAQPTDAGCSGCGCLLGLVCVPIAALVATSIGKVCASTREQRSLRNHRA